MKLTKTTFKGIISLIFVVLTFLSCVQKEHEKQVTFEVDMNNVENVTNVGLRGQFTSPPWEVTLPMADENQDGVYELSITQSTAQNSVEFKFVNQNEKFELECQPNRSISFDYQPEVIHYTAIFNNLNGKQKTK